MISTRAEGASEGDEIEEAGRGGGGVKSFILHSFIHSFKVGAGEDGMDSVYHHNH